MVKVQIVAIAMMLPESQLSRRRILGLVVIAGVEIRAEGKARAAQAVTIVSAALPLPQD